jgi:hypothetical protein
MFPLLMVTFITLLYSQVFSDMFIFRVVLSTSFLSQFDSKQIEGNQSLFEIIPQEDSNWREIADHTNSPC